ncbi:MAG: sensor signal transduction histidine kinase [Deltaproteobacteria bacterium]|nr:sensor signal transduction histidine kinase [Deltaproteobacteria bacterium]
MQLRRGTQAERPLHVAIVGGGKACSDLLHLLDAERLSRLKIKILGVFDKNAEAPGIRYAKELNLFVTDRMEDLFALQGLNLIIELTGVAALQNEIYTKRPVGVSVMDHKAARLLWDLIQIEAERSRLERERQDYQRKSREQTQVILDSLPYRIMVVNMDMTIDVVNRTFLKEHGLTDEEVAGRACYAVRYGLDKPCSDYGRPCSLSDRMEELKEKGLISTYLEYQDEQGKTCFDVCTAAPVYNEKGEVHQVLEASRDVTERMRLQREAQRANTFFEKLIQSIVDGIVVVDTKGNVLIFNEAMQQLTGYSAAEIMNKGHLGSFYDIEVAKENMKKMRSDQFGPYGKLNPTSMTIKTKKGEEIPVTLSASLITVDGKEVGSVGVFTDMREILKIRRELEDANIQLIQSQKIASIGRMAAGVAHEINNPLSGILIYTELLKESLKERPEVLKDLQEIIDQTLRCKTIASELLEFSRKSAGKISFFSLDDLISKCLALLINKASFQNIAVTTNIDVNMPNLTGDMSQLQQVFTNLFINAADAMEGKGKLHIRATFDQGRSLFVIQVADTGPGIPQECRDKIFDIFFTTKPAGKGTGLGLSVSQNILKIHGGHIAFECPPEGGTVFTVELPLSHPGLASEGAVFIGEEPVFIE